MSRAAKKAYGDAGAQQAFALGVIRQTGGRIIAMVILHSLEMSEGVQPRPICWRKGSSVEGCREIIVMCSRDDLPRSPGTGVRYFSKLTV